MAEKGYRQRHKQLSEYLLYFYAAIKTANLFALNCWISINTFQNVNLSWN